MGHALLPFFLSFFLSFFLGGLEGTGPPLSVCGNAQLGASWAGQVLRLLSLPLSPSFRFLPSSLRI